MKLVRKKMKRLTIALRTYESVADEYSVAGVSYQMGMLEQDLRDFNEAEKWYNKSLDIYLKLNNEHGVALAYHRLGMVAEERRDFYAAEKWYKKSLKVLKQVDPHGADVVKNSLARINAVRNGAS